MVTAHNAEHGGETEAAAGEFRREEGVEDFREDVGGHATTGVAHLEKDILALGEPGPSGAAVKGRVIGVHEAGGHDDFAAAITGGVGGVEDQVHHDLAELSGVGQDGR